MWCAAFSLSWGEFFLVTDGDLPGAFYLPPFVPQHFLSPERKLAL